MGTVCLHLRKPKTLVRLVGLLLIFGGLLSYVPGFDWGLTLRFGEANLGFVFSLFGYGVCRFDHVSRRIVLAMLLVCSLPLGLWCYWLVLAWRLPETEGARPIVSMLSLFVGYEFWSIFGILSFGLLCIWILGNRRMKLLFEPSRVRHGFAKRDREKIKDSSAKRLFGALGAISGLVGCVAAFKGSIDTLELEGAAAREGFLDAYRPQIEFLRKEALYTSGGDFLFSSRSFQAAQAVFSSETEHAWMAPVDNGAGGIYSTFLLWPQPGDEDALETFDRLRLEPLPDGYAFDYPLLRQARGWRGDEEVRVLVYEDLVSASERARQIKVNFALEQ